MATHNKTIKMTASKLGLGEEEKLISKAAEFERLLQTKTIAVSNMTDTSKIVVCLDLAAGMLGVDFDVKIAIKYSGLKPAVYTNNKKVIQNLLELDEGKLTTLTLSNMFQCCGVTILADKILAEYQKQAKVEVDLNLPQYVCMAVYQACRISKVKIPKAKIVGKSRLKPAQWTKLDADWTKLVDEKFAKVQEKRGSPDDSVGTNNDETENRMDTESAVNKEELSEPKELPYLDWKNKVLNEAYEELKALQQKKHTDLLPRRSPRKSPYKLAPAKSPVKKLGSVRLLFPL